MDLTPNLYLEKICDRFVVITTTFTHKNGPWKSTKLTFLILSNIGEHECLLRPSPKYGPNTGRLQQQLGRAPGKKLHSGSLTEYTKDLKLSREHTKLQDTPKSSSKVKTTRLHHRTV